MPTIWRSGHRSDRTADDERSSYGPPLSNIPLCLEEVSTGMCDRTGAEGTADEGGGIEGEMGKVGRVGKNKRGEGEEREGGVGRV